MSLLLVGGSNTMNAPTLSPQESQDHAVFIALMWALSRPGEVQGFAVQGDQVTEPVGAADSARRSLEAVGEAVLDLETSFYTPDPALQQSFSRLGARAESPAEAAYLFFPQMDTAAEAIAQASVGTLLYPDHAATVAVVAGLNKGPKLGLRGPGIKGFNEIQVDLPQWFWTLREERVSFPLGWDVLIISPPSRSEECPGLGAHQPGVSVTAIPRSTRVEVK